MDREVHRKFIEQAVGRYELTVKKKAPRPEKASAKIITISRQIGAGGREIAGKVGEKLGCMVWGREILDVLASQSGGDYRARMFTSLDERTQGAIDELVSEFFGRVGRHTYHYLLPKAIFTIAQSDAILLGRGANLILPQAYHVRITAPEETRVRTMIVREQLSLEDARSRVKETDHQRDTFLKEFANTIHAKQGRNEFDLTINTDRITIDAAASIILHGFELFRMKQTEK